MYDHDHDRIDRFFFFIWNHWNNTSSGPKIETHTYFYTHTEFFYCFFRVVRLLYSDYMVRTGASKFCLSTKRYFI